MESQLRGSELDHYATLGVSPEASPAALRAAYLDLMRRYHPDRNRSEAAAAQTRAITIAYAVLGTTEGRARYDLERQRRTLVQLISRPTISQSGQAARWKSAWLPPFIGIAAVLLLVQALFEPPSVPAPQPTFVGGAEEQKLSVQHEQDLQAAAVQRADCSSPAVTTLVRRAVFARAARLRPDHSTHLDSLVSGSRILSAGAVPIAGISASGVLQCEGVIAVDLPRGMVTSQGAKTIEGSIGFALKPASQGAGPTVGLTSLGTLPATLSTIRRATSPPASTVQVAADRATDGPIGRRAGPVEFSSLVGKVAPTTRPAKQAFQNPSFSCHSARTQGALLVCNSAFLAALDREMAALYSSSAAANPAIVPLLRRSDNRFLARRDACSSERCVVSAYFAAIKEIQDIRTVSLRPAKHLRGTKP